MQYGICNLSITPLRLDPSDDSELTSQLLYGDHFKILEQRKKWSRIRIATDKYEGWVDNKQYLEITEEVYDEINAEKSTDKYFTDNLVDYITTTQGQLMPLCLGSCTSISNLLGDIFEGDASKAGLSNRNQLIETALLYLNSPYLWGGKTPFGIDCSGFTQMVYKIHGVIIKRDASQQAKQGEALSFIEESQPGDLAFFDNSEGNIVHVGIIMADNYVIHAHGKVRIDRIDHTGIFNVDSKRYSHQLRVIKKII